MIHHSRTRTRTRTRSLWTSAGSMADTNGPIAIRTPTIARSKPKGETKCLVRRSLMNLSKRKIVAKKSETKEEKHSIHRHRSRKHRPRRYYSSNDSGLDSSYSLYEIIEDGGDRCDHIHGTFERKSASARQKELLGLIRVILF